MAIGLLKIGEKCAFLGVFYTILAKSPKIKQKKYVGDSSKNIESF